VTPIAPLAGPPVVVQAVDAAVPTALAVAVAETTLSQVTLQRQLKPGDHFTVVVNGGLVLYETIEASSPEVVTVRKGQTVKLVYQPEVDSSNRLCLCVKTLAPDPFQKTHMGWARYTENGAQRMKPTDQTARDIAARCVQLPVIEFIDSSLSIFDCLVAGPPHARPRRLPVEG
jgi:hypothetical protein